MYPGDIEVFSIYSNQDNISKEMLMLGDLINIF